MKQKDVALILVVIFFAAVVSLVVTKTIFVPDKHKQLQAEVVEPIKSEFREPDKTVFNENAINPTQLIQIGDNNNTTPF
jgi:mannitol-specific phosphotransferase system IIBC component